MTYHPDCTLPDALLEQIAADGLDVLSELDRIIINTAMQLERQHAFHAAPYERSPERRGYANGFKKIRWIRVGYCGSCGPTAIRFGGRWWRT